jgi:uncharacterized protein (TIGR02001 family)
LARILLKDDEAADSRAWTFESLTQQKGLPIMTHKRSLIAAAVLLAGSLPAIAAADEPAIPGDFSANVALTSDYRFRGISQNGEEPAIQGGLDYSVDLGDTGFGLYAGAWGSSINFGDGDQAQVEMDWYGGVTTEVKGVGVDLGVIYYSYPGAASSLNYDYVEGALNLSYSPTEEVTLGVGYNYSPNYFGDSGTFHYPHVSVDFAPKLDTPFPITLGATAGYNYIEDEAAFGVTGDYADWSVSVGTSYKIMNLSLAYIDSNEPGDASDSTFVVTLGASF